MRLPVFGQKIHCGFDIGIYPIKHPNCYNRLWKKLDKIHVISDDIGSLIYNYGFKGKNNKAGFPGIEREMLTGFQWRLLLFE